MLYIFCGDDTVNSRRCFSRELEQVRQQGTSCIIASDVEKALQELQSVSLFQTDQAVALENVLSRAPTRTLIQKMMASVPKSCNLYIWEGTLDPKSLKKYFPQAQLHTSMLPTSIWKFLDALAPGNLKTCMRYKKILGSTLDEHMLLYLMQRRIKDLLSAEMKLTGKRKIAPWQASQLLSQARKWGMTSDVRTLALSKLYQKLYDIEVGIKTGQLSFTLDEALDLSLCFYLQ